MNASAYARELCLYVQLLDIDKGELLQEHGISLGRYTESYLFKGNLPIESVNKQFRVIV